MDLQKYKNHLLQTIKDNLSKWLILEEGGKVANAEIYRFLHSIKGTSGTLQIEKLLEISENLLEKVDEDNDSMWDVIELKRFLSPLIEFTYEYENFNELTIPDEPIPQSNAPLIQIIDDDPSMLIMLKEALEENNWMVMACTDPEQAVKQYFEMKPDCLILDVHLPHKNGFEVLQEIQEYNEKYFIPTIMISIEDSKQTRIKAYQNGADDFIQKPIDLEEFVVRVKHHLQRKKMFDQSVLIDELTQVYNRRFLVQSLPRFFQDFKRTKDPFSICIVDIDYFKKINDTYGHLMGDKVLQDFAQYLKQNIRSLDVIYRYGGEEFVIVFPKTTSEEAKNRLTELNDGFSSLVFTHQDINFTVTFSAGVFMVEDETVTIDQALKMADSSLYEAKNNGRAQVVCSIADSVSENQKGYLNISVVDDNFIIRTLLANELESLSINRFELNIKVFENGPAFLNSKHAKEDVNHLLILDGVMPKMDGIEVLQQVKQWQKAKQYKVIMLTGRSNKSDVKRALMLGADDYIIKPFEISDLQARIERLLNSMK
ncbi:diguanylate cyclase [Oceanobacillus arenosus]|uniref:Diguanylate cyclase n=1 Tax=Oceanobacillus arenosus TaxID=1229153 RepID=A0A3D8Q092_9BACI|nr:response regulator [Oceanobacillus arenosus]RDW21870.1 diguanylate cyclase [Oceanobacillus arenosus]